MEDNTPVNPNNTEPERKKFKKLVIALATLIALLIGGVIALLFLNRDVESETPTVTPTYTNSSAPVEPTVSPTPNQTATPEPVFTILVDGKTYTNQEAVDTAVSSPAWIDPVLACRDDEGYYNLFFTSVENVDDKFKVNGSIDYTSGQCVQYIKEPTQEQIDALTSPVIPSGGGVIQGAYPFNEVVKILGRSVRDDIKETDKFYFYEAMADYQGYLFTKKSHAAIGMADYPNMTAEDGIVVTDGSTVDLIKPNGWTIYAKYGLPKMTDTQKEEYRKGWDYASKTIS